MPLDFPESPTAGQKYQPGRKWRYSGARWDSDDYSTLLRDRLVNPCMQISNQFGRGGTTGLVAAGGGYAADQWMTGWNFGGATVLSHSYEPGVGEGGGGPWPGGAVVLYSSAPNPLGAANHYGHIYQPIEGNYMADAQWGTAAAKPVVFRFMAMSVQPGTYSMTMMNTAQTHSFYQRFTITAADTWQEFVIAVPACTIGVWPTDNTQWGFVCVNAAFTTAYIGGAPGVWNTGMFYTDTAFNAFQGLAGYFRIAKCGLYLDPYGVGVAPYFEHPQYAEEERKSMRYWYRGYCTRGLWTGTTYCSTISIKHPVPMRAVPSCAIVGGINVYSGDATGLLANLGIQRSNTETLEFDAVPATAASFIAWRTMAQYMNGPDNYIAVNARM